MGQAGKCCLFFRCSRQLSGGDAEFFPVITVVTNEVRDLAEGLVRDGVLKGQAGGCLHCFKRSGGAPQAVVVEGGKQWTVRSVTHIVGLGTRKGIHRRLGCEKCGAVGVGEKTVTVWLHFVLLCCV